MKLFLWTVLVVYALDILGRVASLATGDYPPRTPRAVALDLVINCVIAGWVIALLAGEVSS